jgi:hypothetical protein
MKNKRDTDPDIAPEYDFSKGRRALYLEQARHELKLVPLKPSTVEGKPAASNVKSKRVIKSRS